MEPKNIKKFQELVERYETITLEEIKGKWTGDGYCPGRDTANKLTGFGDPDTCTLCLTTPNCIFCVYHPTGCASTTNGLTYKNILDSGTPEQLLIAFRNRAKHLRKTYPQYLI